jgi:hypothetical protein
MKYFISLLVVLLLLITAHLSLELRHAQRFQAETAARHESELAELADACEAKIAKLRREHESRLTEPAAHPDPKGIFAFLQQARDRQKVAREELLHNAQQILNLDQPTYDAFLVIIEQFEQRKKEVLDLSIAEKRPVFEPRYLNKLEEHRNAAIARLESILSQSQFHAFLEREMDIGLGLHGWFEKE